MMNTSTRSFAFRWLPFAILALAAILRFQNLGAIEHNVDHAYPVWQALMTLDRGVLPVTAQGTSVLFDNPALTGYLFIPWVIITRSPIGPYVFVLLLNTFAVWLAYRTTARLLDERHALLAGFLMAVNPWVIEYSRTTWVQALIPFFACLIFWLLTPVLLGVATHPRRRLIATLVAVTAMTQTYLLAFLILTPVVLLLVLFRRTVPWRAALIGGGIFVVVTGLYALGLASHSAETLDRVRQFTGGASQLSPGAWMHAVRLVSGENYAYERRRDLPMEDVALREYLSEAAHYLILVAILAGTVAAMVVIWRRLEWARQAVIVLIWFGLPILLMTYVSKPVHPFYLLLTLPAGYMLAAWGAGLLFRWRIGVLVVALCAILFGGLMAINTVRFAEATLSRPMANGFSAMPLNIGRSVATGLNLQPGLVVFADADEWTLNSLAGQLFPVDRDVARVAQLTYAPVGGATYLQLVKPGTDEVKPIVPDWSAIGFVYKQDTLSMVSAVESLFQDGTALHRVTYSAGVATMTPTRPILKGDRGISFLGWYAEKPLIAGTTASLLTFWWVDSLQPDRGQWLLGPFIHVYDSTGKRVAIGTGAVVPGAAWRLDDIHIQRTTVNIPTDAVGPFKLQIGQYDGVHNMNVMFTLPDGTVSATIPVNP